MGRKNTGSLYRIGKIWWAAVPTALTQDGKRGKLADTIRAILAEK